MALDWLNYHHLHYFWVTAREGSLTRAAGLLRLAPSTVSAQIKQLEDSLDSPLFERRGRGLVLTPTGRLVADYADEIFALGRELTDTVRHGGASGRPLLLRVGAVSILDKLVVHRLLAPALRVDDQPVRLVCVEDDADVLVDQLSRRHLDLVLTDAPVARARDLGVDSHLLGTCGVAVFSTPRLAAQHPGDFPGRLRGAPFLLPGVGTTLRVLIEQWFQATGVEPAVAAEFSDSALMNAFGREGVGFFVVPDLISPDLGAGDGLVELGTLPGVVERFIALTPARQRAHPAVDAIVAAARARLG
ncbi:MAG: LysR family transcriptional regulator [Oligoflexia bacterium]|nr:LysR family transcriptional regulator [Oligoflexia bacterium]